MLYRLRTLWRRLRRWLALRLGPAPGNWTAFHIDVAVARWTGWAWPWQARQWPCELFQPLSVRDGEATPLLLLLHGCKQQARPFAEAAGWTAAAERGRFRLLCPQQVRRANPWGCWNWFHPGAQRGRGELDVMREALAHVRAHWPTTGVAAVGLSAGGGLAALLAFHAHDVVDAVATVAAPPLLGSLPLHEPRKVMAQGLRGDPRLAVLGCRACAPLLVVQGDADEVVVPRCAEQLAQQAAAVLARAHGALTEQATEGGSDWQDASGRRRLSLRRLPGLGHAWSGAPGGHDYVQGDGPDLTGLVMGWLTAQAREAQPA